MINRMLVSVVTAGLLLAAMPCASQAQSFAFSIGTGYHHHGHYHPYGCGPYWGPPWYGPAFGFAYAPPPLVEERIVYVQPPRVTTVTPPANTAVATAAAPAAPTSATLAAGTDEGARITIHNSAGVRLPVTFMLDGQDLQLADGASQTFVGASRRTIAYDRGGHYGSTRQDLTAGDYEFRITPSGWDLVRTPNLLPASRNAVRANTLPPR